MKKASVSILVMSLIFFPSIANASTARSVVGKQGQVLKVNKSVIKPGGVITITGNRFNKDVGIYVAFCKLPKKGELPTPCGGGVDLTGATLSSVWISSNPPSYGDSLVKKFGVRGNFKLTLRVQPNIGDVDCRIDKCAITVRADHTRSSDRSFDLFIPITFK